MGRKLPKKWACWIALACLVVPMFASYYFDDMFSSISYLFQDSGLTELHWDENDYGRYTSGYSVLCIIGGLALFGILLDKWGVRVAGTLYVGMMVAGAGIVTWALLGGQKNSAALAYAGCMVFGLGSEMAGTVVNRSIGRWFKDGGMALAMGLHLAIARLGTAFALVVSPKLVAQQADHVYSLAETARPALLGMGLMAVGLILWAAFVAMDAKRFPKQGGLENKADDFRFKDLFKVLGNKNFWLLGLLCVLFYSSIIAFKKFAGAILIPRFNIPAEAAGWMVSMLPFSTVIFAPLFGLMVDKVGKGTRWMIRTCCWPSPLPAFRSGAICPWRCWASATPWSRPPCGRASRRSSRTRSWERPSPLSTGCRTWACWSSSGWREASWAANPARPSPWN